MPIPQAGEIDFDDLNDELGNTLGTQLDIESAALEFAPTRPPGSLLGDRPHGMDEFYGASLIPSASTIAVSPTSVSFSNVGATSTITVTSNGGYQIEESLSWISLSTYNGSNNSTFDITADENDLGGIERSGSITLSSNDAPEDATVSVSQPARPGYMIMVFDPFFMSLNGGSFNIQITADPAIEWTLTKDVNSTFVTFANYSGVGSQLISVSYTSNAGSSETRQATFTLDNTNYTFANIVTDIVQQADTIPFDCSVANITGFAVDVNGFVTQPTVSGQGIVYTWNYSAGYSNGYYPTVGTDTPRSVSGTVFAPVGYSPASVVCTVYATQPAYVLPTYTFATWDGSVSVDGQSGNVSYVIGNGASVSTSPTSWPTVDNAIPRTINVTVGVPAGYSNSGTVSGTKTVTQPAYVYPLFTFAGWTGVVSINELGTVLYTAGNAVDAFNVQVSPPSYQTVAQNTPRVIDVTIEPIPAGYSNTDGLVSGTRTATQPAYVPAPTISIYSLSYPSPYDYYGQGGIMVTVSRTNSTSYNAFIDPSIQSTGAYFPSNQSGYVSDVQLSNLSSNTFYIDIPARSDGTTDTYESFLVVNTSTGGGFDSDTYTLQQTGLVTWNTSPSSLSFGSSQQSLSITLNTNLSWTAQISGTGFSIAVGDTSGNGTATFSILATTNSGSLRSGILSFSSPGQTTIQVTLTQDAYVPPSAVEWTRTPTSLTWGGNDTFYQDVDVLFQNRTSTITWSAILDSSQHFEISLSPSSGYSNKILSITNNDLIYVRPKNPNSTEVSYDTILRFNPVTSGTGLSELTVSLSQSPSDVGCLLHGTKVMLSDGSEKLIEHLKIGDSLKSLNIEGLSDGEVESLSYKSEILNYVESTTIVKNIKQIERSYVYSFNKGLLISSYDHNHFILRNGIHQFLSTTDVIVGDSLMDELGDYIKITSIDKDMRWDRYVVFKLDVEEYDLFFANGILTHNVKVGPE